MSNEEQKPISVEKQSVQVMQSKDWVERYATGAVATINPYDIKIFFHNQTSIAKDENNQQVTVNLNNLTLNLPHRALKELVIFLVEKLIAIEENIGRTLKVADVGTKRLHTFKEGLVNFDWDKYIEESTDK